MARHEELIVGLDIGTTKISAVIVAAGGAQPEIVGVGTAPSRGLQKGVVTDMDATVESIEQAVEEAESVGDCEIHSVYVGIAGAHIASRNEIGILPLRGRDVRPSDVKKVVEQAQTVAIPGDHELIHVIAQEYEIDGQEGIKNPIGMSGVRLTARVHLVSAAIGAAQNLVKCCQRAELNVIDIVLQPLASSESVLAPDECSLGVALIDIGGGTTDLAVFGQNAVRHTAVIGLGGHHLSKDVAYGLRTTFDQAEQLKCRFGCATRRLVQQQDLVAAPGAPGRPQRQLSRKQLAEILEPRVEEMLTLVRAELERTDLLDQIPCGIVLTGGSSALEGLPELATEIFEAPVRRGMPHDLGGLAHRVQSPEFATGVGLALWGAKRRVKPRFRMADRPAFRKVRERMRSWLFSEPS
jgi:cell division protein FtsA